MESRYYIDNLEPEQRADGFISILHPPQWWTRVIEEGGVHVAVTAWNPACVERGAEESGAVGEKRYGGPAPGGVPE